MRTLSLVSQSINDLQCNELFSLRSEHKAHLSTSETSDPYSEEDGDEDFQGLDCDGDDEADREDGEAADSSLPNAFDRLRVSDRRNFNGLKLFN